MTTLDTLGTASPDPHEVADAALAMADFDAKRGDYAAALDWLAVAEQHRGLTVEYLETRDDWEAAVALAYGARGNLVTRLKPRNPASCR